MDKKRIIIIGAGISGLTAGIYALDNNFEVQIFEKHFIAGGQCTGWDRQNLFIDGCAHWIVGTNPTDPLNKVWKHIGAFDENTKIHPTEYFKKFDVNGEIVTLYADLEKLENELLRVSSEDKRLIKSFIRGIKTYRKIKIPLRKPIDHMNLFELTAYGISMLPVVPYLLNYMHISSYDYAEKFKSPILKEVFHRLIEGEYNVHSLFYIMQALSKDDAGMVEGGSRLLANNVKNTFLSKGGILHLSKEVDHILIENNIAKGVVLKNGDIINADYVVSSTDAYHTMNVLLQGKYEDKYYDDRFKDLENNPLQQCLQLSYKVSKDMNPYPKMMNIKINPIKIVDLTIDDISIRNHAFDKVLYPKDCVLTVLMKVNDSVYDYFKSLDRKTYLSVKQEIGNKIKNEIQKYYHIDDKDISLIDVTTPLTYERYTNAYKGSYMSFITTKKVKGLMRKGVVKKLKNFVLSGQWIMPPGGLPIAVFTGKHAIERICKMERKPFVELDFAKISKKELA